MRSDEAEKFFANFIWNNKPRSGLWPDWDVTSAEVQIWILELLYYDYDVAKTAVHEYYKESGGKWKKPKLEIFTAKCKKIRADRARAKTAESCDKPNEIVGAYVIKINKRGGYKYCTTRGRLRQMGFEGLKREAEYQLNKIRNSVFAGNCEEGFPIIAYDKEVDGVLEIDSPVSVPIGQPNPDWVSENPEPPPDDDIPF